MHCATILLVEDNTADAQLLIELMAEKNAVDVKRVEDGYRAMDYICRRAGFEGALLPDLIILDLGLPRISGYEVLKQIKEDARFVSIPIIILTTSCNPLDRTQCNKLGADAFISKPHNLKGYEAMIEQLLDVEFPKFSRQKRVNAF